MTTNRRQVIGGLGGLALAGIGRPASAGTTLGAAGAAAGILFGSAFDREIFTDEPYRALIARECRIGTTENSLKFDWLRPRGPNADFAMADRLVGFANQNGIALRGTALVWNDWPPRWLSGLSRRELIGVFDRHIDEVLIRYLGRLHSWDVVNEPFFPPHGRDGGYRKGPWFDAMGKDYVRRAFRRAAQVDPTLRLTLNEAFCEQEDELGKSVRPRLLRLIDEMRDEDVPLHAVGLQGHLKPHLPFDDGAFTAFLHEIARRGLAIYITELDVDDSGLPDDIAERDRIVAARHHDFLRACLSVPQVEVVITWHLSDRYSWYGQAPWYPREVRARGGDPRRQARTHIHDHDLRPKAAHAAVTRAFAAPRA